jgi:hypothetical protein
VRTASDHPTSLLVVSTGWVVRVAGRKVALLMAGGGSGVSRRVDAVAIVELAQRHHGDDQDQRE